MTEIKEFERLGNIGWSENFIVFESIDSTNNYIKQMCDVLSDGHIVVSGMQYGGRGRQGKSFYSPEGGLYMSVLVKEPRKVCEPLFTARVCLAVCRALEELCGSEKGKEIGIKWVNDVYYKGKKLAGILCERHNMPDGKACVVVGIGINLKIDRSKMPRELRSIVTGVFDITRKQTDRIKLAVSVCEKLKQVFDVKTNEQTILDEYKQKSIVLGNEITVIKDGDFARVRALDISPDGALLVKYEDGLVGKLSGGEISVRLKK